MLAAASMRERASRSLPSSQARGRCTWISLIPSSAMPSASGWNPGAQNASKQCTKASIPVAAVIAGGRPTVSSGSLIHSRHHLRVEDDFLLVGGFIDDHAGAAHLGARAGGGWNRDYRCDAARLGACPPVAQVLEIP